MIKVIVCIIAGLGAGLGTGFAGMSAAAVISPMLITFLDMDPYMLYGGRKLCCQHSAKNGHGQYVCYHDVAVRHKIHRQTGGGA